MVELSEATQFGSGEYGRQRSVLFAIVLATGFLAVAAGAGAIAAGSNAVVGAALFVVGVVSMAGAAAIAMGEADEYLFE